MNGNEITDDLYEKLFERLLAEDPLAEMVTFGTDAVVFFSHN